MTEVRMRLALDVFEGGFKIGGRLTGDKIETPV